MQLRFRPLTGAPAGDWTHEPRVMVGDKTVLGHVADPGGRVRFNLAQHCDPITDTSDRQRVLVDGVEAWWCQDFNDVEGVEPVTNVVIRADGLTLVAAGCDSAEVIAAGVASILRRSSPA